MQIRQLLIRPPGPHVSSISRFLPLLNALSLEDKTLELVRWRPSEGWAAFLKFRLRPMAYFVHAAVTHDFTLIGAKGVYSLVELDHIKYWVGRVLLHCVEITALVLLHLLARRGHSSEPAFDYPAFDEHGQLLIPDFYSVEALPQDVSLERNNRGHPVSTR
ncbi:hypothetical protein B0H14DRAFT_3505424 [Mycena olivaceomarginata]|nr:hypothetical protein B0H14DRAFT_3505424 [Mycena olivaceomarginata]